MSDYGPTAAPHITSVTTTMIADRCLRHRGAERASQLLRGASGGGRGDVSGRGTVWAGDLPRAFRTADLRLIHAAICCSRYSSWTCCGVRYWSPECRRLELYQNSMYLTTSRYA